jgi:hypothetical protein
MIPRTGAVLQNLFEILCTECILLTGRSLNVCACSLVCRAASCVYARLGVFIGGPGQAPPSMFMRSLVFGKSFALATN